MNNSKQRNLILNIINNSTNHPTAYDIYKKSKTIFPNISLGTIYRNLNLLYEKNMIIKVHTNDAVEHYDKVHNKHTHFICDICNTIYDIEEKLKIRKTINGNKILDYSLNYTGICHKCLKKEEEKNGIKRK